MNGQIADTSHGWLGRALVGYFGPGNATIETSRYRRWASATFSGGRHSFTVRMPNGDPGQAAVTLPDHDFPASGPLVADIRAVSRPSCGKGAVYEIEALTVEGY
jgi:hypothetical protein